MSGNNVERLWVLADALRSDGMPHAADRAQSAADEIVRLRAELDEKDERLARYEALVGDLKKDPEVEYLARSLLERYDLDGD